MRRITSLSNALALVGREGDAAAMRELAVRLDLEHRVPDDLVVSLVNWAISFESDGRIHTALRLYALADRLAVAADEARDLPLRHLARLAVQLGRWDEADAHLAAIEALELDDDDRHNLAWLRASYAVDRGEDPAPRLAAAWRELERAPSVFHAAELHALVASFAMKAGDYAAAEGHLSEALQLARRMGSDTFGGYSARLAVCLVKLDRTVEARRALADARAAPERYALSLARAHLALGERAAAAPLALAAYRIAWADGPPFAWLDELRSCEEILAELGVQPPALPPFDPARTPRPELEVEVEAHVARLEARRADR